MMDSDIEINRLLYRERLGNLSIWRFALNGLKYACRSCNRVGGQILTPRLNILGAVLLLAVMAIAVSSAAADDSPPATITDGQVTVGQPVPVPDDPEEPALPEPSIASAPPVVPGLPGPGPQVQSLLIKQVRSQIVLYRKSAWRWERLMGLRVSPGGNIWSIGSLPAANKQLAIWKARSKQRHETARDWMRQRIEQYRREVNHMSQVMGTRPARMLLDTGNLELRFVRSRGSWRAVQQRFSHPPYQAQFMCIHFNPRVGHGEGPWDANTGNDYFGGLQMNQGFMSSYGAYLLRVKGTADHWTALEQIWVASKAVPSRGFHPWPNTARTCGLLASREV